MYAHVHRVLDETGVLRLLEEKGVVERIMESLQLGAGGGDGGGRVGEGRDEKKARRDGGMAVGEGDRLDKRTGEEVPKKGNYSETSQGELQRAREEDIHNQYLQSLYLITTLTGSRVWPGVEVHVHVN